MPKDAYDILAEGKLLPNPTPKLTAERKLRRYSWPLGKAASRVLYLSDALIVIDGVRRQALEEAAKSAQAIERLEQWRNEDKPCRRWDMCVYICVGFQVDLREYEGAEYKLMARSRQPTLLQAVTSALAIRALAKEQAK